MDHTKINIFKLEQALNHLENFLESDQAEEMEKVKELTKDFPEEPPTKNADVFNISINRGAVDEVMKTVFNSTKSDLYYFVAKVPILNMLGFPKNDELTIIRTLIDKHRMNTLS